MDDDQRRNPELTTAILFLGLVLLFSLCVGAVMLITAFYPRPAPTPTPDLFPKFAPVATSTPELVLVVPATLTPTATPTATLIVITPTSDGNSCRYGPPWINTVATVIPDGGQSAQQDYKCVNGYWYLGGGLGRRAYRGLGQRWRPGTGVREIQPGWNRGGSEISQSSGHPDPWAEELKQLIFTQSTYPQPLLFA